MRTAFIEELLLLAESDARIWLVTGDLGYSVVEPFAERYPDRFLNAGVAEQNMIGVAAGLARCGARVFVYSIANFPTFRCLEQIRNDVCYADANVIVVSVGSGFSYGALGSTHHAIEDLAVMRALPGMVVVSPGDPVETRLATRALASSHGPAYLRLGKAGESVVNDDVCEPFELGVMRKVREGTGVTILATGSVLAVAAETAERLAIDGISARVYSAHTLKPFDSETLLRTMAETAGVVTVEEHRLIGGLRGAVAEALVNAYGGRSGAVRSIGVEPDGFMVTGDQSHLRATTGITVDSIAGAVRDVLAATSEGARVPIG